MLSVPQAFNSFMNFIHYHASLVLSNWANKVNLTKKAKLRECLTVWVSDLLLSTGPLLKLKLCTHLRRNTSSYEYFTNNISNNKSHVRTIPIDTPMCIYTLYRLDTINLKSFIGKNFLWNKWKHDLTVFELAMHFKHEMIGKKNQLCLN